MLSPNVGSGIEKTYDLLIVSVNRCDIGSFIAITVWVSIRQIAFFVRTVVLATYNVIYFRTDK